MREKMSSSGSIDPEVLVQMQASIDDGRARGEVDGTAYAIEIAECEEESEQAGEEAEEEGTSADVEREGASLG